MFCWALLTLALLARLVLSQLAGAPSRPFAEPHRVDLNRATIPELMSLPGMGEVRARAVVLHRVRHGRFRVLAELAEVDGLGPVTVARLRPFLRIDDAGDQNRRPAVR